jgi:cytoskeletal protein CcmA (bactofilin family)
MYQVEDSQIGCQDQPMKYQRDVPRAEGDQGMKRSRSARRQEGMVLIHVTLVMVLSMLVIPPILGFVGGAGRTAQILEDKTQAFYGADAGRELGCYEILHTVPDGANGTIYSTEEVKNECDVSVAVDVVDDSTYRITSASTDWEGKTVTVTSHIYRTFEHFQNPAFDHAIAADESITISQSNSVTGNMHCNGWISMDQGSLVTGDVSAVGSITGGNVTGTRIEGAQALDWPTELDTEAFEDEAMVNPYAGNYTVGKGPDTIYLGPLYVEGNLNIGKDNRVIIVGTVYVEGTITFGRNAVLGGTGAMVAEGDIQLSQMLASDPNEHVFVMSATGDINVDQTVNSRGLIYAPNGDVRLNQDAVFTGSVVGKSVEVSRDSIVTYERITDIWDKLPGSYSPTELAVLDYIIER